MTFTEQNKSLDMVLIGGFGDGKSETGNSIVGRNVFGTSNYTGSVTLQGTHDCGHMNGHDIRVFDISVPSEDDELKELIKTVKMAIAINPIGYHAFLYVKKFGRKFTKDDDLKICTLKSLLGDNFLKSNGILVITCGDDFKIMSLFESNYSFDDWLQRKDNTHFTNLLKECSYRDVLFDNRTDDLVTKIAQVRKLVELIESLPSQGKRFTNRDFQVAEMKRKELLKSETEQTEKLYFLDKIGALISKMKNAPDDEEGSKTLLKVGMEIEELETSVTIASSKDTRLKTTLSLFVHVRDALLAKKNLAVKSIEDNAFKSKMEKESDTFQMTSYKDLKDAKTQFELLEKRYIIEKNSISDDISIFVMDCVNF